MRSPAPEILAALPWLLAVVLGLGPSLCEARAEPGVAEPTLAPRTPEASDRSGSPRKSPPVVVESVLGEGEDVRAQVEAELLAGLDGVDLSTPDGEPVVIVIAEAPDDGAALRVGFRHGAGEVYEWTCRCSGLELQEQLPGHTREALRRVRAVAKRAVVEPSPPLPPPPRPVAPPDPRPERRYGRALGMFATGGVMTMLGGGAVLAGGAVMITRASAVDADVPPWAIALTATGAAAVAVGVPLLVVGHRRIRSERSVTLRLVPAGPGLALRGRF
jgi:hypothetical protein